MPVVYRNGHPFVPYSFTGYPVDEMRARAQGFYREMDQRRSVRAFSDRPVPRELIELAVRTAATAPSGAHLQPWCFAAVDAPDIKRAIREAAEAEERENYAERMPEDWLDAISPMGTDWHKPFLETAPWLVVLFEKAYDVQADGTRKKHYYVRESVGIAAGMFIAALHHMGLATLTHTPSPMKFLTEILGRPGNERPLLLFPIGYPAADALVPDLERKPLEDVSVWNPRPAGPDADPARGDGEEP